MIQFDIKPSADDTKLVVTSRAEVEVGARHYPKGDTVFELPRTCKGSMWDMKLCLQRLEHMHRCDALNPDDRGEFILSHLYSDKFIPMSVYTTSPSKMQSVKEMFKVQEDTTDIKGLAKRVVEQIAPQYVTHVTDAYVSSIPTEENLYALQEKFCKGSAKWDVNPMIFQATLAIMVKRMEVAKYQMIPTIDPDVAGTLGLNPNAGTGFKHWNIPIARNKRNYAPYMDEALKQILEQMPKYVGHAEDIIPPMMHVNCIKKEVRAHDAEKGKVRVIGMVGLLHDMITKLVSTPFMQGFQKWESCLIGTSVWKSLVPMCMKALRIGEFNDLPEGVRGGYTVEDLKELLAFFTLDLSSQDLSFKPGLLFALLMFRSFYVNGEVPAFNDVFNEMFAYETASVSAKQMEWFGKVYYMVLGIMTSGYGNTSHIDTFMLAVNKIMAMINLGMANGVHPKDIIEQMLMVLYGDDDVSRFPVAWLPWLDVDPTNGFPRGLAAEMAKLGCTLKPGETKVYVGQRGHRNKFFTRIKNDEIISEGVHILQRYFVKYDQHYNPLPPDSKRYFKILPWRKTDAYCTRMATDANGFRGKEGRLDDDPMDPYLACYVKNFGLLMDAGPNRKAHSICKGMMREIALAHPDVPKVAPQAARGMLQDIVKKLGESCLDVLPAVANIWQWDDECSFHYVVSRMGIDCTWNDAKEPDFLWNKVSAVDDVRRKDPYLKDGNVYYP